MRRLLYVPVIHEESDIGASRTLLGQRSRQIVGIGRWEFHERTVRRYWESVATHLRSVDLRGAKLFQDGLTVGGETGERIVAEAARTGSHNYRLLLELIERGARLQGTEKLELLLQERDLLDDRLQERSPGSGPRSCSEHRVSYERLLTERDRYIAGAINESLWEGELGVLFIGAQHEIAPYLAPDIGVEAVANPRLVRAYMNELFSGSDNRRLEEIATRLAGPDAGQSRL